MGAFRYSTGCESVIEVQGWQPIAKLVTANNSDYYPAQVALAA
jgi:hypothetical protein